MKNIGNRETTMEDLRTKLIYTAVIFFLFLQLALRYGICGPTLSDLKDNLGVTTNDMSKSVSVMCIGICIGAISSGFICKFLSRELLTSIMVLVTAVLVASITFLDKYRLFLAWNLMVGLTSGASISICESWILEIWGNQCGPYMQALQFFRGLGYIIAPLLADPFLISSSKLSDDETTNKNNTVLANLTKMHNESSSTARIIALKELLQEDGLREQIIPEHNSKIRTPYILIAIMLTVAAIFLICLYILRIIRERNARKVLNEGISQIQIMSASVNSLERVAEIVETKNVVLQAKTKDCAQSMALNRRAKLFGYAIVAISSIFYLFFYEEVVVVFLPTFATHLYVKLSKREASMLSTAFSLANLAGKAIGVLLTLKISHFIILYASLSIMIGSLVTIIIFADSNVIVLWIAICIHGIGLSSIIASLYTLMESTIEMSPQICGILNMFGTCGSVIMPLVIGQHMDHFPMALMYACLVCAVVCLVLYTSMHILLCNKSKLVSVSMKIDDLQIEKNEKSIKAKCNDN